MLWAAHVAQKHRLMRFVRVALRQAARHGHAPAELRRIETLLNPGALTLGWARRFAPYKRRPPVHGPRAAAAPAVRRAAAVQLVIAGKAHPADRAGRDMIRRIWELAPARSARANPLRRELRQRRRAPVRARRGRGSTAHLAHGGLGHVRPKAACNGVLNVSVPDGWWAEAYAPGLGFRLGEPAARPGRDSGALYELLEQHMVPLFYDRDADGLPRGWIAMMRASMSAFLGRFSTRRMLRSTRGCTAWPMRRPWRPAAARRAIAIRYAGHPRVVPCRGFDTGDGQDPACCKTACALCSTTATGPTLRASTPTTNGGSTPSPPAAAALRAPSDAEAFALLMRLTRGRLLDIATRLAAAGAVPAPAALVESVLAHLFNDPPAGSESSASSASARADGATGRSFATRPNGPDQSAAELDRSISKKAHVRDSREFARAGYVSGLTAAGASRVFHGSFHRRLFLGQRPVRAVGELCNWAAVS